MRVAVIMGGLSAEREVSLKTGAKVMEALDPARFEAFAVDPRPRGESTAWLETLLRERVDVAFLGTNGISAEHGFSTPDPHEGAVKRAMARCAAQVFVLGDASKMDNEYLVRFAEVDEVDALVTDADTDPATNQTATATRNRKPRAG